MNNLVLPIFDNLTDDQNSDLQDLLKYKIGLFQVYTGYGKSELMATVGKYLNDSGIQTLFITASSKALLELKSRCIDKFGIPDPGYYDTTKLVNIINAKGFWSSNLSKTPDVISHLRNTKVILFDEVEQSLNDQMIHALDNILNNRICLYGFSATANKSGTDRLTPKSKEYYDVVNNRLVSYFGYATVFRTPPHKVIDIIRMEFPKLKIPIPKIEKGSEESFTLNYVKEVLYDKDDFIYSFNKVIEHFKGTTFIPINRVRVIQSVVSRLKVINPDLKILILDSTGFSYEGNQVSLGEAKELVSYNKVNLFFSTSSGYNSLDFKNINNVYLMLEEKAPHHLLQAIGRSREIHVKIYYMLLGNKIPIYNKKLESQVKMIKDHYKLSVVNEEFNIIL